jgi:hypothetical protein
VAYERVKPNYLLTAIGFTPSGNSTVHTYTQTMHRTTKFIHRTTQLIHCGAVGQDTKSEISGIQQLSDYRVSVRSLMCDSAGLASLENQIIAISRNVWHRTSTDAAPPPP